MALYMGGCAGAGKTTLLRSLAPITDWPCENPDTHTEDPSSPMFKNLSAASAHVEKSVAAHIEAKRPFVWDTTSSNRYKMLQYFNLTNSMLVVAYAHPIVALMQNLKRERTVSRVAILSTWAGVYGSLDAYHSALGNRLVVIDSLQSVAPQYAELIDGFDKAAGAGAAALRDFLESLVEERDFSSTYRKENDDDDGERDERTKQEFRKEIIKLHRVYLRAKTVAAALMRPRASLDDALATFVRTGTALDWAASPPPKDEAATKKAATPTKQQKEVSDPPPAPRKRAPTRITPDGARRSARRRIDVNYRE